MLKKHSLLLILSFLLLCIGAIDAQTNYQKGWGEFQKNNRTEARKYFTAALSEPSSKSEALLSLCLIDWNENKLDEAFTHFTQFYDSSTNPYPYLYAMGTLPFIYEFTNSMSQEKLLFFERIVEDPKMNGTLKAMISERLGYHYERLNNPKKAEAYYAKMGAISNWQVLGAFDNTSGSGFSKDWGAVLKARENDVFVNNVNASVNWYYPGRNKMNNWFDLDYHFFNNNAIMYAQTFVNSEVEQDAFLRVGTSGSLKVWLNDALIGSVTEERNCDLDTYNYKVKLKKGANRILVQIGKSEIDRSNFLVRLTDENAIGLTNISHTPYFTAYEKDNDIRKYEQIPVFVEKFFVDKLATEKDNILNYLLLAEAYLHNDKAFEATNVLKQVESLKGHSTLISYLLYDSYIRAKNQTDYEKELETIKSNDPNCFFSLSAKYRELIKTEKYSEAFDICKQVKDLYGVSAATDDWDCQLASYQKRYDDLISLAKELFKKYPEEFDYVNLIYVIEKEVNKNPKAAIKVLEDYCKKFAASGVQNKLSKAYLEQGNAEKGLAVLYKRLENYPYESGCYVNLINTLFDMQLYEQALAVTQRLAKIAPFMPNAYTSQGYIYKNLNLTDKAKEAFKKSIYFDPTIYEARTQLRLLDSKKDVYSLFPKSNLNEIIAKGYSAKDFPEDNSIILLNEMQQVIYPEGAKEYRSEVAIKILKKSGIEDWKEYSIGYNGYSQKLIIDKAEVLKSNGSVVKAETDDDNQIVFTNLEVDDVLHIEYRIQDLSTGKLASQFFDHFQFQYSIPTVCCRYSLLVPSDKKFNYKVVNGTVEPEITSVEDLKLYKWELNNQPAVKHEPNKSALIDIVPCLFYSSIPDWNFMGDWYKDLTTSKFNPDFVLNETYSALMKGKENISKLEKVKLFYNYILENITYSSVNFLQSNYIPQKASRTITTRLGDCKDLSTLFVALCRKAGIEANLVLISTRNNGNNSLVLPGVGFNHCIAQLTLDNKKYYLELTDNTLPFGAAVKEDINAEILTIPFVSEQKTANLEKLNMPERLKNASSRSHKVSFTQNDMIVDRQFTCYGSIASYERSEYKNEGDDERLKKVSEAVAKVFDVSTKVSNLKFQNLENLSDSTVTSYKLEVKNALQDVAGMKIFRFPWYDRNSLDIVSSETRKYPFEYWSYQVEDKTVEQMVVELPQGKSLAEAPKNITLDCPIASYSLKFNTGKPGKIVVTRTFIRKSDQISTQDYSVFKDFINKVSEADNKQYAFK